MECQFWIFKKEKRSFWPQLLPMEDCHIAVTNVTWNHVLFLFGGNRFLSNRSLNSVTSQTDKIVISLPIFFVMSKVNVDAMVMKINVLMTNPNAHSLLLSLSLTRKWNLLIVVLLIKVWTDWVRFAKKICQNVTS